MEYYSAIKRNEIVPFAEKWMDLETVIQSEISQKENDRYHILMYICGIYKNVTNDLICETERDTDIEDKYMDTNGEGEMGGIGKLRLTHIH